MVSRITLAAPCPRCPPPARPADHGHPGAAERLRLLRAVPFGKLLPAPIGREHRRERRTT
ncbi:hypothetical protein ABGB18_08335 [Nonomuraea sp. B12E4]|uniref:hypothetical protein n=1 Tax=Nonomuraea sp. B12E4 TaxID=3153564 RepID=UPI00325D8EF3